MTTRRWWLAWLVLLAPLVQAAAPSTGSGQAPSTGSGQALHAFLDRNHISLGDTVTLNIQSDGPLGNPDLSPLQKDFEVLGTSRSSSVSIDNGRTTSTSRLGIALKPLHAGTLMIPALAVDGAVTRPLTLEVGAAPSGGTGKVGDPVFMETSVQSSSPWVGQQTVYTLRLFYLPGVDGALGDPGAAGARLIPLDRDHRYVAERDGYTYKVIERSWALIPERTGTVTVQGPVFQGQRLGPGVPNAWFNDPNALLNNPNALLNAPLHGFGGSVRATAPVVRIDARAMPANAGKPWLPARDVELKLTGLPANDAVTAGAPLTVTLSISASGQPAGALPEPELPPIAGARVYPGQTRNTTDASGEWLQGTRSRSFAIVPDRNGVLSIPAITLNWWDVVQNRAEQAALPVRTLNVSGVVANTTTSAAPPPAATTNGVAPAASTMVPGNRTVSHAPASALPWREIALASLVAWLLAIVAALAWWGLRRSRSPALAGGGENVSTGHAGDPDTHVSRNAVIRPAAPDPVTPGSGRILQRQALDAARMGDAAACERCLLTWARATRPAVTQAGWLRDALADPAQRDALDALQRARWQGGDAAPACAAVARAFAHGFAWHYNDISAGDGEPALPPLYPSS